MEGAWEVAQSDERHLRKSANCRAQLIERQSFRTIGWPVLTNLQIFKEVLISPPPIFMHHLVIATSNTMDAHHITTIFVLCLSLSHLMYNIPSETETGTAKV